jgi:hypothetical protein
MELNDLTITDGYIGAFGKTWRTPTATDLEMAIEGAMRLESCTRAEIVARIDAGETVKWCQSPNFYYDHSYGLITRRRTAPAVEMVRCDCGHMTISAQVLHASLGTSCPDCYDRMSD